MNKGQRLLLLIALHVGINLRLGLLLLIPFSRFRVRVHRGDVVTLGERVRKFPWEKFFIPEHPRPGDRQVLNAVHGTRINDLPQ